MFTRLYQQWGVLREENPVSTLSFGTSVRIGGKLGKPLRISSEIFDLSNWIPKVDSIWLEAILAICSFYK